MAIKNFKFKEGVEIRIPIDENSLICKKVKVQRVFLLRTYVSDQDSKIECFSHDRLFTLYMRASLLKLTVAVATFFSAGFCYWLASKRYSKTYKKQMNEQADIILELTPLTLPDTTP